MAEPMMDMQAILPDAAPDEDSGEDKARVVDENLDAKELSGPVEELFTNYAKDKKLCEKVKVYLEQSWPKIVYRDDLESIWKDNDKMWRCQPLTDTKVEHRANWGVGEFHIAINQLQSMTYNTFTKNPNAYKFAADDSVEDDGLKAILKGNSEILNKLLYLAFSDVDFKRQLRRLISDAYKKGNLVASVEFRQNKVEWNVKNKKTGKLERKEVIEFNLPMLMYERLDQVWLDATLDNIEDQPYVYIRRPITLSELIEDEEAEKVILPKPEENNDFGDEMKKYVEASTSEFETVKNDQFDNAGRDYSDRQRDVYKHWVVYVRLPLEIDDKKKKAKWVDNGKTGLFRVRLIGDPTGGCKPIEIRENILPGGIPLLWGHQTEDGTGMYHMSLGEKLKTYYEQLCTAYNQETDNRSKNTRRPVVYDVIKLNNLNYDFGHSNAIPVEGDPRSAMMELGLLDMTATIQNHKSEISYKIKEISHTTEAVMGQAMGARTSASEYMGAQSAATTPIYADMAQLENDIIVGYMKKFHAAVDAYLTHNDIVDMIGQEGAKYQFNAGGRYKILALGVVEAEDSRTKVMNLTQLLTQTQDPNIRARIQLRLAEAMKLENPSELVPPQSGHEAIKAALFENTEMLVYGKQDRPMPGELHDTHLSIHREARWTGVRDKNPNVWMMDQHIQETEELKRREQVGGGFQPLPGNGPLAEEPPLPGLEAGGQIGAAEGAMSGGSQVPVA